MRIAGKTLLVVGALAIGACTGPTGPVGPAGPGGNQGTKGDKGDTGTPAATTGTISGTVTDGVKMDALAGVTVTVKDTGGTQVAMATTDNMGLYSVTVPLGTLVMTLTKTNYTTGGPLTVGALAGQAVTVNATLTEAASGKPSVTLMASPGGDVDYGTSVTVTAQATDPEGDTVTYTWSNNSNPVLGSVMGTGNTATATMPTMKAAMAARTETGKPQQTTAGYTIRDQFGVIPIMPDTRGQMSVKVVVADGRGQSTTATIGLIAASIENGTRVVAKGSRVYLNGGAKTAVPDAGAPTWTWTVTAPDSTTVTTTQVNYDGNNSTSRYVSFVADQKGKYTIVEGSNTLELWAGNWVGAVDSSQAVTGSTVRPSGDCTMCHDGTTAPDKFTPWLGTGHATKFARGVTLTPPHTSYSASCISCHVVGYDVGVSGNNGFDDVASAAGWTFPTSLTSTTWSDMVANKPAVAELSNIQCENCHGPQDSGDSTTGAHKKTGTVGDFKSPRITYSAELCGTCHASGTGHHLYSEWSTKAANGLGHSNRAHAISYGLRNTSTYRGHCVRCHAAQGFVAWLDNLEAGKPGKIETTNAVLDDITTQTVEPQTCQACHDPHSATNPNQLRVYGETEMLPSGFKGYGLGKGALCVTCHNSRNGMVGTSQTATYLHEDGDTHLGAIDGQAGSLDGYGGPHASCQGDVLTGHNAYFMGNSLPMTSKHTAVEDSCVGCHMKLNPTTHDSHGAAANSTHQFRIEGATQVATVCANCHSANVNGEGIQGAVEAGLEHLSEVMAKGVETKLKAMQANGATIYFRPYDLTQRTYSSINATSPAMADCNVSVPSTNAIVKVTPDFSSSQRYLVEFTSNITWQPVDGTSGANKGSAVTTKTLLVPMASISTAQAAGAGTPKIENANLVFQLGGNLAKATWNFLLVEEDQSKGLHNPSFVLGVLNNTAAQDLSN